MDVHVSDPRWRAGIRHATRVLEAYLALERSGGNPLLDHPQSVGSGAAAKPLGNLLERIPADRSTLIWCCTNPFPFWWTNSEPQTARTLLSVS
jgi:hypothetical protein